MFFPQIPLSVTQELLFLVEERELAGARFRVGVWAGSPQRKKQVPLEIAREKRLVQNTHENNLARFFIIFDANSKNSLKRFLGKWLLSLLMIWGFEARDSRPLHCSELCQPQKTLPT